MAAAINVKIKQISLANNAPEPPLTPPKNSNRVCASLSRNSFRGTSKMGACLLIVIKARVRDSTAKRTWKRNQKGMIWQWPWLRNWWRRGIQGDMGARRYLRQSGNSQTCPCSACRWATWVRVMGMRGVTSTSWWGMARPWLTTTQTLVQQLRLLSNLIRYSCPATSRSS